VKQRTLLFLSAGHLFTDFNQGALPAILPFLISERGLSYTAAAGLVFASTFASSIVQPLFGHLADRFAKPWLMPLGIFLAGLGIALTGITDDYWLLFAAVTVSGIGVAAFHPEGARLANRVSGEKKGAGVSIFSVGGSAGFALGPLVTTGALLIWGLKGTVVLIIPIAITAFLLVRELKKLDHYQSGKPKAAADPAAVKPADEWAPFSRLTVVVFCRSAILYALNTFIPLFWIYNLGQSKAAGGTALTILFTLGAIGTLIGGRLGDRFGYPRTIRVGFCLLVPVLFAFTAATDVAFATLLLLPLGFALFAPMSPMIVLGQKYLPNRMGLASGVTLGLAVSVGGITTPVLGWLADHYGLAQALTVVAYIPILAALTAFTLPAARSDAPKAAKA
jgi:FSR family fosmidomycin resistance protein-like MFS transporter